MQLGRHAGQLLDVLDPSLRLDGAQLLELREVAGLLCRELHHPSRSGAVGEMAGDRRHHGGESGDRALRARGERRDLLDPAARLHHVDVLRARERLHRGHGGVPDPSLRRVDGAPERDHVLRIGEELEVGEDVLDLLALVEAHPAEDAVGHPDPHQDVLDHSRLRVGPIEDRDVPVAERFLVPQAFDLLRDEVRLAVLVVGAHTDDLVPDPASVQRFFGLRWMLFSMSALATVRMFCVER